MHACICTSTSLPSERSLAHPCQPVLVCKAQSCRSSTQTALNSRAHGAAASSRTAARYNRPASEESCLTSDPPPPKPPTTTTTMKRTLKRPVEEYAIKWLCYGAEPHERCAHSRLSSHAHAICISSSSSSEFTCCVLCLPPSMQLLHPLSKGRV